MAPARADREVRRKFSIRKTLKHVWSVHRTVGVVERFLKTTARARNEYELRFDTHGSDGGFAPLGSSIAVEDNRESGGSY